MGSMEFCGWGCLATQTRELNLYVLSVFVLVDMRFGFEKKYYIKYKTNLPKRVNV